MSERVQASTLARGIENNVLYNIIYAEIALRHFAE